MARNVAAIASLLAILCGADTAGSRVEAQGRPAPAARQPSFVGKTWLAADASAAPGSIRTFLPDGTLIMTSCVESYRLARWMLVDAKRVSWQEDGARVEAEITRATVNQLQLRLRVGRELREETYRLARVPYVCPETRGTPGATSALHVEGTLIYLERLALPPTAVVRVELRDVSRADAGARTIASQSFKPAQGPPFHFALDAPRARIDPRASLALHAEIRDGSRLMFATTTRYAVPQEGASGMEVRLAFLASARGGPGPGVITPVPAAYRCGGETFKAAFEDGRAYVTLPDATLVTLARQNPDSDPREPRRYSNGRLTVVQEFEGQAGPRVLFARGRRLPAPCTRQE